MFKNLKLRKLFKKVGGQTKKHGKFANGEREPDPFQSVQHRLYFSRTTFLCSR